VQGRKIEILLPIVSSTSAQRSQSLRVKILTPHGRTDRRTDRHLTGFYHATRMHSADYAMTRCLSVCPSVHPHTPVLCVNGYTYPQGFFTILVFPHQTGWQYSDWNPPNGGAVCKGVWKITICDQYRALSRNWCKIELKNHDLRPISGFISELMQNRAIVTMESK